MESLIDFLNFKLLASRITQFMPMLSFLSLRRKWWLGSYGLRSSGWKSWITSLTKFAGVPELLSDPKLLEWLSWTLLLDLSFPYHWPPCWHHCSALTEVLNWLFEMTSASGSSNFNLAGLRPRLPFWEPSTQTDVSKWTWMTSKWPTFSALLHFKFSVDLHPFFPCLVLWERISAHLSTSQTFCFVSILKFSLHCFSPLVSLYICTNLL